MIDYWLTQGRLVADAGQTDGWPMVHWWLIQGRQVADPW